MKFNSTLLLFLLAMSTLCSAQKTPFNYKRKVSDITQEGWYTLTLPPDIFIHTDREFNDLRLYGIAGSDTTEFPYVLDIRETDVLKTEIGLPVINKSKKDGILFLGFELAPGQKVNLIRLAFEEPNFFASVKIEGSADKKEWFEIADNERIFSIRNSYEQYENGIVNFPVTDYRYLRVSIKSDTPLTFTSASFLDQEVKEGTFENIPLTWKTEEDKKAKKTVVNIKLAHYRPVSNLHVQFSGANDYYRSAEISYLADSAQTQKGWIRNYINAYTGYVTSYNPNSFDLGFQLTNEVRLTIYNYDNSPLTISSIAVTGAAVELKALLKPRETFLFYGNKSLSRPSYDIDHFKEKIPSTAPPLELGSEENIAAPQEKVNALFENKIWLWAIMLTMIAVLGFFTLRMMKGKGEVKVDS
jgi:hypothetical protein